MVQNTSIEWTDRTANPIRARHKETGKVGWHCVMLSPGCAHCFSSAINNRFGTKLPFTRHSMDQLDLFLDEKVLKALLKLRKPQRVFICDMTDMFGDWVPDEWLDRIFAVMALCRNLTFQVLTKRAERLEDYVRHRRSPLGFKSDECVEKEIDRIAGEHGWCTTGADVLGGDSTYWLPRNVWLGVSVENQKEADERIPHLARVPAAVRFLSVEPLLGPVDLSAWLTHCTNHFSFGPLYNHSNDEAPFPAIGWVIVGGESGPGARPMHPAWVRSIRDQCVASGTAYFFKQWGEWRPDGQGTPYLKDVIASRDAHPVRRIDFRGNNLSDNPGVIEPCYPDCIVRKVGKKAAGRLLDGRTWDELPAVTVG